MSNYRRRYVPGGTYFFTVNLLDRSSDLLTNYIEQLRLAYAAIQRKHPFETIAIVILPEHMHCVWQLPQEDHDFSLRWRLLKSEFSRRLRNDEGAGGARSGERAIWQRRFWEHLIRDEDDLERHVNYIHFNPVKHGYVSDVDDWPHSSWHRWKKEVGADLLKIAQNFEAGERS